MLTRFSFGVILARFFSRCAITLLFLSGTSTLFAQEKLLDSLSLANEPVYTDMEKALKESDNVYKLNLSRKKLNTVPPEIFRFKNLQVLDLSRNRLTEIPKEIGTLVLLQHLDLSRNDLTELPPEIGELINLKYFYLGKNELSYLPQQIGQLQNLEILYLWDNNVSSLPDAIQNLTKLRELEMRAILISDEEQQRIWELLPHTKIFFSPSCNCKM